MFSDHGSQASRLPGGRPLRYFAFCILHFAFFLASAFAMLKPQFGGNLKVANELLAKLQAQQLFELRDGMLVPQYSIPYTLEGRVLTLRLEKVNPEVAGELRKAIAALQDHSNECHWLLDYPYFDHRHPTAIELEDEQIMIRAAEEDYLKIVASSPCLLPPTLGPFQAFRRTQFGWEANIGAIAGRPFLDSISPIELDLSNPLLSLKLEDVDVTFIPEDRFQQAQKDAQLALIAGPRFFVYLKTNDLAPQQAQALADAIDLTEISRPVFNDHVEILLSQTPAPAPGPLAKPINFRMPAELPYRLLAERLLLQWKEAGITITTTQMEHPNVDLIFEPVPETDTDVFRYLLLRKSGFRKYEGASFEEWDEIETSGRIIPLVVYTTTVAYRKNIQSLKPSVHGFPDFANCWVYNP